jgi:hypothetical protein
MTFVKKNGNVKGATVLNNQPEDFGDKCPTDFGEISKEVKEEKKAVVYDIYKILQVLTQKRLEKLQYPIFIVLQENTIYLVEKKPKKKQDKEEEEPQEMELELPKGKKTKPILLLEITPLYVGGFVQLGILNKDKIFDDMLTKFSQALAWLTSKGVCLGDLVFAE